MNAQANERDDHGKSQAIAQAASIAAMVVALNVDYDRLEELREAVKARADDPNVFDELSDEELKELAELEEAACDNTSEDDARGAIQNDPLSVQVREDWKNPGEQSTPSEFQILLCTGGPAVRIMGELDDNMQPCRAWIEYQDWGTPWTQLYGEIEQSTLLGYCQQFYFGE